MTQTDNPAPVLCAGRLYCDLVFTDVPRLPTLGTETFAKGLGLHAGGGAFITAATLSALGQPAALLSTLPAAPFDRIVENELRDNNVDTSACTPASQECDPQITVAIASGTDRAFLSRRSGVALPPINANDIAQYSHLHIGEIRTLKEHPELIERARSSGLTISLDCGWDDELMANVSGLSELIAAVDIFLPNEMETHWLENRGIPTTTAPLTVIKNGGRGAQAWTGEKCVKAETTPVEVVDATGAGDAFNGGFIFRWLRGASIEHCLNTGNMCGAAAVQGIGGTGGLPSLYAQPKRQTV